MGETGSIDNHLGWAHAPHRKLAIAALLAVLVLLLAGIAFAHSSKWPFSEASVTREFQHGAIARVEFGSFHETFLPHPGYVAENVRLWVGKDGRIPVSLARLTLQGSYTGLIGSTKRMSRIVVDQPRIEIPSEPGTMQLGSLSMSSGTKVEIDSVLLNGAEVTLQREKGSQPLIFRIPRLEFQHFKKGDPAKFSATVLNPLPAARVEVQGEIGPVGQGGFRSTPISANYRVIDADLGVFPALDGHVAAKGHLQGDFNGVAVNGEADTPDFALKSAKHKVPIKANFAVNVDMDSGRTEVAQFASSLGSTEIDGHGVITPADRTQPIADLVLQSDKGRVDDLLRLFVGSPRPAMRGPIRFRTTAQVDRGDDKFLKRVRMRGEFLIQNAHFNSPQTQQKLDKMSARAQGDKDDDPPEAMISRIKSRVDMAHGVAQLGGVEFQVPGASATGGGSFDVITHQVRMDGTMRMEAQLSEATKGVKSFLLKFIDPIYKKHRAGAEVPVIMRGTSQHPTFHVELAKK